MIPLYGEIVTHGIFSKFNMKLAIIAGCSVSTLIQIINYLAVKLFE
jgi:hypothetical protein